MYTKFQSKFERSHRETLPGSAFPHLPQVLKALLLHPAARTERRAVSSWGAPPGPCCRGGDRESVEGTAGVFFRLSAAKAHAPTTAAEPGPVGRRGENGGGGEPDKSGIPQHRAGAGPAEHACYLSLSISGILGHEHLLGGLIQHEGVCAVSGLESGVLFSRWSSTPSCGPRLRMGNGIGERSSRGRKPGIFATSRWVVLRPCHAFATGVAGPCFSSSRVVPRFSCAVMRDRDQRLRFACHYYAPDIHG